MVVCPELGFSRYALRDEDDARAVARESARALAWAREIAMTYDTHVALGHCREEATSGELFNSQTVFAPDGDVARRYDKSHLYFVDEAWAVEGRRGFEVFTLAMKCFVRGAGSAYAEVVRDVKCVSAICMDINPFKIRGALDGFRARERVRRERFDSLQLGVDVGAYRRPRRDQTEACRFRREGVLLDVEAAASFRQNNEPVLRVREQDRRRE